MAKNKTYRIYSNDELGQGLRIILGGRHYSYIVSVMRSRIGDAFFIFNEIDGEWLARIDGIDKKQIVVELISQVRSPTTAKRISIGVAFAPIKNPGTAFCIQKAVELGATDILPLITERTIVRALSRDRLQTVIVEAVEQCERLDMPILHEAQGISNLQNIIGGSRAYLCDEHRSGQPLFKAALGQNRDSWVIIGPEGGFTDNELELMKGAGAVPVSLSRNILRAETALIGALAILMQALETEFPQHS